MTRTWSRFGTRWRCDCRRLSAAANKFLARLGSNFQKPDGLTLTRKQDKVEFLKPLSVRSIHAVRPVTAQALEAKGLLTIADLQATTLDLGPVVGSLPSV